MCPPDQEIERKELSKYNEAREKVKTEIVEYRQKVDTYDKQLAQVQQEVAELERRAGVTPTTTTLG